MENDLRLRGSYESSPPCNSCMTLHCNDLQPNTAQSKKELVDILKSQRATRFSICFRYRHASARSIALISTHTATQCNTLQHTHTLQHTATNCNTLQHLTEVSALLILQRNATHTATHCNASQKSARYSIYCIH